MTKGIEAFNKVVDYLKENTYYVEYLSPELNIIQQELESLDNANPSEAMDRLEYICKILHEKFIVDIKWVFKNEYNIIKQALIKAQEDENLKVDICEMFGLDNLFPYNDTKAILKELEEYMDRKNQLWVDFMKTSKKLKEQEKVLDILKEKNVDIKDLKDIWEQLKNKTDEEQLKKYNCILPTKRQLTQEEFELLKRWLG